LNFLFLDGCKRKQTPERAAHSPSCSSRPGLSSPTTWRSSGPAPIRCAGSVIPDVSAVELLTTPASAVLLAARLH